MRNPGNALSPFGLGLLLCTGTAATERIEYEPTWESLDKHPTPEWLMDAKLGIFVYGPNPTKAEWEAHQKLHGHKTNVVGHVLDYYPEWEAVQAWDQVPWNPDGLAQLAADAGARYLVYTDGSFLLMRPSKVNDVEGSAFMRVGEQDRDYVGDVARAVRARGLRFGLYTNLIHPGDHPQWLDSTKEAIDRYQPSTLWFDGNSLKDSAENMRTRELLAYYYNHSEKQDEVAAEDALGVYKRATWGQRLVHGDWFRKEATEAAKEISDGYHVRYEEVTRQDGRSPTGRPGGVVNNYVEWLAHTASHNGNLELTIWMNPRQMPRQKQILRQVGIWLEMNGEAIYDTRPWHDGRPQTQTTDGIDVRFTTKDDALYAILFEWPRGKSLPMSYERQVSHIGRFTLPHLRAGEGTTATLLGRPGELEWHQEEKGLTVVLSSAETPPGWHHHTSAEIPCDHAFSFKIEPIPAWVE